MRFIIGGAFEGKELFCQEKYGVLPEEIIDCAELKPDGFRQLKCVRNFHLFIKNQCKTIPDLEVILSTIIAENPGIIIIMDEVGCGIVPVERSERELRELVGRAGCFLASRAESVDRVICGCGVKLK